MGTEPSDPSSLAEPLRSALAKEVDPNESLRWCGQLASDAAFRRAMPLAIGGLLGFGAIGLLAGALAFSYWQELSGLEPLIPPDDRGGHPSYSAVVICGVFAAVFFTLGAFSIASPWFARAESLRTVYAVTNTRVLELVLSSTRPDASTRIQAVEPGHPLHIRRTTNPDGRGDIYLYPAAAPLPNSRSSA